MPDINLLEINENNVLSLNMGDFEQLDGVLVLSQWVMKLLLTDPNDPMASSGAVGLHKLVQTTGQENLDVIISDKISHIENFIQAQQEEKDFDDNEELDKINLNNIEVDQSQGVGNINIDLTIINKNGNRSNVTLPIGS